MTLAPLPVTVISGYLGAGKTSLINHLLRHADGRRILVLVNDFGAINIDADLLESASEDTVLLSNGCVCCTLGGDLMHALGDALDRRPRPDCLVIEASGVAEPRRIAAVAMAEPEMRPGGVVTLADAENLVATLDDPRIGAQVGAQIAAADLVALTRGDRVDPAPALARIAALSDAPVAAAPFGRLPPALALDAAPRPGAAPGPGRPAAGAPPHDHGVAYASWSHDSAAALSRAAARGFFDADLGAYRMKGLIRLQGDDPAGLEAHRVGAAARFTPIPRPARTRIVAIGLAARLDPARLDAAFAAACAAG